MKVNKINTIKNLAVFKDFKWDDCVKDKDGKIQFFHDINIIYGRNYSGKTTLSRIFRAFETGKISDKYLCPEFQLEIKGSGIINQTQISNKQDFRVFNTDFIDENLSFLRDSENGKIQPFAILGDSNTTLVSEIERIQNELGKNTEEEKTGLYKELNKKEKEYKEAETKFNEKNNSLSNRLTDKARTMKNNNRDFVDATYNITHLKSDIEMVSTHNIPLGSEQEINELKKLLLEEIKTNIQKASCSLKYGELIAETKSLLSFKVESANKIQELVENALLNNWVKEGIDLHRKRNTCAFCGQTLPSDRLEKLQHHFNEEMEVLQNKLKTEIIKIEDEKANAKKIVEKISETDLYVKFQNDARTSLESIKKIVLDYCKELDKLSVQLENKKKDVFHELVYAEPNNLTQQIEEAVVKYNGFVDQALQYGQNLQKEKENAKKMLRLNIVKQFVDEIKYSDLCKEINKLKNETDQKKRNMTISGKILTKKKIYLQI